jgi:TRAP-type C4-dicarboxylate transport system substrate-binding protein
MKTKKFGKGIVCFLAATLMLVLICPGSALSKPIVLKFGTWMPEKHETSKQSRWWAEQVEKRTDGQFKIEFFYAGALGKGRNQLDNMKYGTFDIGPILPAYDPAKSPLWTIIYLPWVSSLDPWVRMKGLIDLSELPVMEQELTRWDTMFLFPYALGDVYYLWTVKKPVRNIEELKGLKIRSLGEMAQSLSNVGANPVSMPMPDVYNALAKGIVDGGCFATAPVMGYRLFEICKYKTNMLLGSGGPMWVMKKSVFEKLPTDVQKVIKEVSQEMTEHMAARENEFLKTAKDTFVENGVTIIEFPPEEQKSYEEVGVMPVVQKWIQDKEKKGLPAEKVWNVLRDATEKYKEMKNR